MGVSWARGTSRADTGSTALVTGAGAGVDEGLPFFGNELPIVAVGAKGELQDAESGEVANLAVGFGRGERAVVFSTGADDKFTNAANRIGSAVRHLRGKPLIVVVVAVDNHVGVGIVERIPKRLHG